MRTVKEIREALQKLWEEYNAIKDKAVTEERDLTTEEFDRSEQIFDEMEKTKRELALAEKGPAPEISSSSVSTQTPFEIPQVMCPNRTSPPTTFWISETMVLW